MGLKRSVTCLNIVEKRMYSIEYKYLTSHYDEKRISVGLWLSSLSIG